jgi:hypothetical protein
MKKALIALVFPLVAHAHVNCAAAGVVYQTAASMRDSGMSPQQALGALRPFEKNGVPEENLKKMINTVYFDPAFTNAGGEELRAQMTAFCANPNGGWKPLK